MHRVAPQHSRRGPSSWPVLLAGLGVLVALLGPSLPGAGAPAPARLAQDRRPTAEDIAREGSAAQKARNFEKAIIHFNQCLKLSSTHLPCHRGLGASYAALAARDSNQADMDRARKSYERYLELAPPGDEYAPKIRQLLATASGGPAPADEAESFALRYPLGTVAQLDLPSNVERVAVGDAAIVDVQASGGGRLVIKALARGKTTMLLWGADGSRKGWLIEVR